MLWISLFNSTSFTGTIAFRSNSFILHGMDGQVVTILACVLIINVKYLITLTSIL